MVCVVKMFGHALPTVQDLVYPMPNWIQRDDEINSYRTPSTQEFPVPRSSPLTFSIQMSTNKKTSRVKSRNRISFVVHPYQIEIDEFMLKSSSPTSSHSYIESRINEIEAKSRLERVLHAGSKRNKNQNWIERTHRIAMQTII